MQEGRVPHGLDMPCALPEMTQASGSVMKLAERNSASSPQRACSGTTLRLGRFDTVIRVAVATRSPEWQMT